MWLEQSFRQQYGCELLRERCWQFPFKLVLQDRNKRVILGKVQTLIQYLTCHALCFGVREPLRHSIAVSSESYVCPCGDKLRVLQSLGGDVHSYNYASVHSYNYASVHSYNYASSG